MAVEARINARSPRERDAYRLTEASIMTNECIFIWYPLLNTIGDRGPLMRRLHLSTTEKRHRRMTLFVDKIRDLVKQLRPKETRVIFRCQQHATIYVHLIEQWKQRPRTATGRLFVIGDGPENCLRSTSTAIVPVLKLSDAWQFTRDNARAVLH